MSAAIPKISPLLGGVLLGGCGISLHSYMQHECTQKERNYLVDKMYSQPKDSIDRELILKQINYLENFDNNIISKYNVPIFISSLFGGLFFSKTFLGLVLSDLSLRILLSYKKNQTNYSQYELENSIEYKGLTYLELSIFAISATLPLKFLLRRKL
ncbi:transmembrane protein, putative (macronuclear) [Tetrahymena thermophila SB210]|uniref:Transmembrane protein, putative n=1 Tax=Tetrahymena thermophila (strain SB210) TaxID=312017 RepID=I7MII3_TETTS|nr:transmembrane protein, putative [Tetrahymena thermophila SB210]EAR93000.2 transmembrane protein, putative [Tetrahymena thermophila SB210]|eukprot:XP_001013245.2 transmembrane protein, putative [Tetrahymena thermophila SB210]